MNQQQKGFTLIELLIVLALIAILAGIIIVVIKPAEIFKKGRDAKRMGDLRNISTAIDNFTFELSQHPGSLTWPNNCVGGTATATLYLSITTTSFPAAWPGATGGIGQATGTNSTAVNGTGWLPLNLSSVSSNNLSVLPLDPINTVVSGITYAYGFTCKSDFNYELAAKLESTTTMANDGGNENGCGAVASTTCLYETGPAKDTLY